MGVKLTVDSAGRIVIPKNIRKQFRLAPGDTLLLEGKGDELCLKPVRPAVGLKKKYGVWVYHSEQGRRPSAVELIDAVRDRRARELMG